MSFVVYLTKELFGFSRLLFPSAGTSALTRRILPRCGGSFFGMHMPLYRFNLEDHHFIADRGSHECANATDAEMMANEIADRLVQHQPEFLEGGHAIVVRDESNRQIYRAEMDRTSVVRRRN